MAVNEVVKYYVEGRKLHILDDDEKEHSVEILKEIRKPMPSTNLSSPALPETKQFNKHLSRLHKSQC